jgi:hypothetical protein
MSRRLQTARREVERLEWEHARRLRSAAPDTAEMLEPLLRDARWAVEDIEAAQDTATVRAARRTAFVLDVVLALVAGLVMAFSLGNIHRFALGHEVADPLGWLLAPMVDLALIGTLSADAFLSRNGSGAGGWAAALRWFAGTATLALNSWDSVRAGAPGGVLVHVVPPLLLLLLAEAAPYYRRGAAAAVEKVRTDTLHDLDRAHDEPGPDARPTTDDDTAAAAAVGTGQSVTAPAAGDAQTTASRPVRTTPPSVRTDRALHRARPIPGAARNARAVRTDEELLADLRELRTGAAEPLSQRAVLAALGIGVPRLRGLLETHGLTLDPLPAAAEAQNGISLASYAAAARELDGFPTVEQLERHLDSQPAGMAGAQ